MDFFLLRNLLYRLVLFRRDAVNAYRLGSFTELSYICYCSRSSSFSLFPCELRVFACRESVFLFADFEDQNAQLCSCHCTIDFQCFCRLNAYDLYLCGTRLLVDVTVIFDFYHVADYKFFVLAGDLRLVRYFKVVSSGRLYSDEHIFVIYL